MPKIPQSESADQPSPRKAAQTVPAVPNPAAMVYAGAEIDLRAIRQAQAAVPLELKDGDVILDLYEVKQKLGEGGMAEVYQVRHRGWNVDLAVKTPKPDILAQAGGAEAFQREAETWVNIGLHPHIVSCYYVRDLGEVPRIFVEYVEGGSLHDWIYDRRLYEGGPEKALQRILDVCTQFTWGLHHAHELGLVHKDVKPANVMMTETGIAKVTDFGLAGAIGATGTPQYQSPEQEDSAEQRRTGTDKTQSPSLERTTDIWSWGLAVLEMFVGELVWSAGRAAPFVLESYLDSEPAEAFIPKMPESIAGLLRDCFNEDPRQRPQSMLHIADRLRESYRAVTGLTFPRLMPKAVPDNADSLNNRAVSLLDLGMRDQALDLWHKALAGQPHHPESTYNLGLIQWRSGQCDDDSLVQSMEEMWRSDPYYWRVPYMLGSIHMERGDFYRALDLLQGIDDPHADHGQVQASRIEAQDLMAKARTLVKTLGPHESSVDAVAFSHDGRYAVVGGRSIKLWDLDSGRELKSIDCGGPRLNSICTRSHGREILAGIDSLVSFPGKAVLFDCESGRRLREFPGHDGPVISVRLSRDGRYAITGGGDNTVRLWDVFAGSCLRTFTGHEEVLTGHFSITGKQESISGVTSVAFNDDGTRILSAGVDGTLRLWDVATGRCVQICKGGKGEQMRAVAASSHLSVAVSASNKGLKLWDVASGRCLRPFCEGLGAVGSVSMSADGKHAVSSTADGMKLWETETGRCVHTFRGHDNPVNAVCLSNDGQFALTGSWDKTVKLWKVSLGANRRAPLELCRISTTEELITVDEECNNAMDKALVDITAGRFVDAARNLRKARSQPGCERRQEAMNAWTELYRRLPRGRFVGAWEAQSLVGHSGGISGVCLTPDALKALSCGYGDSTVKMWDVASGECLWTSERYGARLDAGSIVLTHDVQQVLVASWMIRVSDLATGRSLRSFAGDTHMVLSLSLSEDDRWALSGSSDQTLKLWHFPSGRCVRTFEGHDGSINSVSLTADGGRAVSGSSDETVKIWNVAEGCCSATLRGHHESVTSVCFSLEGRHVLSTSRDKTLKLWDTADGRCMRTLEGHQDDVTSGCFSPDGQHAFSASVDNTIKVWDLADGNCVRTLEGHTDAVLSLGVNPDCRYLISAGRDATVRLWLLDWELEESGPVEWDEGARAYLEQFLVRYTPYLGSLPSDREPSEEEVRLALKREGSPVWTEPDFNDLMFTLGCAGYVSVSETAVRQKLEEMAGG